MVCTRTLFLKLRVHQWGIQSSIPLPPCLPIVLELMQTLFRRLDTMFLQIWLQKNPAPSPSHCPNSNLSILTIGTPVAHRISEYGHGPLSRWTQIAVSRDKRYLSIYIDYSYLKAILLFNIIIFNNYLGKRRLLSYYFYLIYLYYIIKEVYYILIAIIYNYSKY